MALSNYEKTRAAWRLTRAGIRIKFFNQLFGVIALRPLIQI